jgi:hypothetical protein
MQKVSMSALEFLNIDEETFAKSFQAFASQPDAPLLMEQIEADIREKFEPQTNLTKSKEDYKKIYIDKLKMEAQIEALIQQKISTA